MEPIDELRDLLGADAVLDQAADTAPFLTDWRGRYTGRALAVALPRSVAQLAQAVAWCARHGVPVVAQGGNTGLVGGATPDASGRALVLSTRRLRQVRQVDTANDTITVEAGCLLQEVQQAAQSHDRLFPLSLAAQGSCTIGGNLATNAGGTQVLRYGNARDLALGLEVVLADGTVWDGLRGLRKDNTGYDLKQLFIGSEGTLGIITAATLKLFALPRARIVCLLACAGLPAAIALLARARALGGPALTAFEVMSDASVALAQELLAGTRPGQRPLFAQRHPWLVLLEWSEPADAAHAQAQCEQLCAAAIAAGEARDAIVARSLADAQSLWLLRESIPEAQARQGGNVKHDISLPLGTMAAFVAETEAALRALCPELLTLVFGHLGDGNLHFNVGACRGRPASLAFEREMQINAIVYAAVARHGGSVSAEHGLGQLRRELAQRTKPAAEMAMMRAVKQALDPRGLMNPGKLI
jgi:FAD/FMN-containing dehydrogenase